MFADPKDGVLSSTPRSRKRSPARDHPPLQQDGHGRRHRQRGEQEPDQPEAPIDPHPRTFSRLAAEPRDRQPAPRSVRQLQERITLRFGCPDRRGFRWCRRSDPDLRPVAEPHLETLRKGCAPQARLHWGRMRRAIRDAATGAACQTVANLAHRAVPLGKGWRPGSRGSSGGHSQDVSSGAMSVQSAPARAAGGSNQAGDAAKSASPPPW